MALLSVEGLRMAYGSAPLLDGVELTLERGERACLLGRNGEGKSTLFRLLSRREEADAGRIALQKGCRMAELPQEIPDQLAGSIREQAEDGRGGQVPLRVEQFCSQMELDPEALYNSLSGGQKRRTLLIRALAGDPDLLFLDEPTNHLDLEGIQWMEKFLPRFKGAILFITHDRAFLQNLATRILELDRGHLKSWDCDYATFLRRREEAWAAEDKQNAEFDKKLAQEEKWIRQGIQARRTRNEGRVRALKKLREDRKARRDRSGAVSMSLNEAERGGLKVIEAEQISFSWGDQPIVENFSTLIRRGDKVGVLGPNGCGKSTLLKLLLGQLQPQQGSVEMGTGVQLLSFDQMRTQLDENKSLMENVGLGSDFVNVGGQRRHVISYLEEFLFPPSRARVPVRVLSGGERNRLILARQFTQEANLLVLDEPTNDLDLETLELLESLLVSFNGTLLLVSHDRAFLDNVVSSCIAFDEDKQWREYPGGYGDWEAQRPRARPVVSKTVEKAKTAAVRRNPLNGKEKRELEALPEKIEALEMEMEDLGQRSADPSFYQQEQVEQQKLLSRLESLPGEVEALMLRWEELEERKGS